MRHSIYTIEINIALDHMMEMFRDHSLFFTHILTKAFNLYLKLKESTGQ